MNTLLQRLATWPLIRLMALVPLIAAALIIAAPARADITMLPMTTQAVATDAALRDLWIGHAFWVRNVVMASAAQNKAATAAAEAQVVANAKQIAAAVEPFYGKAASERLFALLAGHYGAVKDYLGATLAGNKTRQAAATTTLTANAEEIAKFLSGANPYLPYDTLRTLLLAHGAHHIQQIDEVKARRYDDEANTWAAMRGHLLTVADALTGGLAQQFPEKFAVASK